MKTQNQNFLKYAGLVAAGALLLAASADAQSDPSVTYTYNYGNPTPLGAGGSDTFSLNQFNPALGTLNDIILTLNSLDNVNANIENFTGQSQNYLSAFASAPVQVSTSVGGLSTIATGTATYGAGTVPASPTETMLPATQVTATSSTTLSSGLSAFEGLSSVNVTVAVNNGTYGGSAPSLVFFGGDYNSSGSFTVEYDYTPSVVAVPEVPMTGSFMGAGCLAMIGFGLLRRPAAAATRA
jgi:hypothetical protein